MTVPRLPIRLTLWLAWILASVTQNGALLINIAVFGATVSYVLMNTSQPLGGDDAGPPSRPHCFIRQNFGYQGGNGRFFRIGANDYR